MTVSILIGDMRERLAEVGDDSVDCIIADPPYGQTTLPWDRRIPGWPALMLRVLKRSGSMWVFGSLRSFMAMATADEFRGWRLAQDVVWEKHTGSGFATDRFRRVHEQAAMFYRADAAWSEVYRDVQYVNDATARTISAKRARVAHTGSIGAYEYATAAGGPRMMRSVIFARSTHRQAVHETQKPEEIIAPLLRFSCPLAGHVLDPFAGSGTTGAVAAAEGRHATLIEKEPKFAALATARLHGMLI